MSIKPTLYILVEIKARELEAKLLIALEAARRGYRVLIGNQPHLQKLLSRGLLPPGIFYYKNLSNTEYKDLKEVHDQGHIIVVQDDESGLLDFNYDHFISFRSTPETINLTQHFYCWGEHDRKAWARHYPNRAENIYATGSPRVDFWRDDFSPYFADGQAELKRRYGNFVLIPTNFPFGNGYLTTEQYIAQGRRNGNIKNDGDVDRLRQSIEDSQLMIKEFTSLIKRLADLYANVNFILRPHPVEKISYWQDALSDLRNVHVIFEGSVTKWVRASKAIIHNGCTTGIEARFSGIPTIAYVPFESPINREVPNAVSITCRSLNSVVSTLSGFFDIGDKIDMSGHAELLSQRFSNYTGSRAVERIVDHLDKINVVPCSSPRKNLMSIKYVERYVFRRFMKRLLRKDDHSARKFPGLELRELEDVRKNLSRVNNSYADSEIKHYLGDIFLIEAKN